MEPHLGILATALGLVGALALLLQAERLRRAGSARDVSFAFLGLSLCGYLTCLLYGVVTDDIPLILVDAVGAAAAARTVAVVLTLRRRSRLAEPCWQVGPLAFTARQPTVWRIPFPWGSDNEPEDDDATP